MELFRLNLKRKRAESKDLKTALEIALSDHNSSFSDTIGFLSFAKTMYQIGQSVKPIKPNANKKRTGQRFK